MCARRLRRLPAHRVSAGGIVHVATSPGARTLGLALLRELPPGHALLIPGCRSVHTFGMRFALDVVFLDGDGRIVRMARNVPRGRVLICRRAYAVLEARAGEAERFTAVPRSPG